MRGMQDQWRMNFGPARSEKRQPFEAQGKQAAALQVEADIDNRDGSGYCGSGAHPTGD